MANEPQKWAGLLGSGADVNTIPEETPAGTGAASMKSIFPPITQVPLNAGGIAPDRADFNGLFKLLGDNIYYQQQGGVYSYSATIDYAKGSLVKHNDKIYIAIQANGPATVEKEPGEEPEFWQEVVLSNTKIIATGTTTARSLENRFADMINVKDFGAKGDGVTNDREAIQRALDNNNGRTIYFPKGVYIVETPIPENAQSGDRLITLTVNGNTTLFGDEAEIVHHQAVGLYYLGSLFALRGSKIKFDGLTITSRIDSFAEDAAENSWYYAVSMGASRDPDATIWGGDYVFDGFTFTNCRINGFMMGIGFQFPDDMTNHCVIKNIHIDNCRFYNINKTTSGATTFRCCLTSSLTHERAIQNVTITNCYAEGFRTSSDWNFVGCSHVKVANCISKENHYAASEIENTVVDAQISNLTCIDCYNGVWIDDSSEVSVNGLHVANTKELDSILGNERVISNGIYLTRSGNGEQAYTGEKTGNININNFNLRNSCIRIEKFSQDQGVFGEINITNGYVSTDADDGSLSGSGRGVWVAMGSVEGHNLNLINVSVTGFASGHFVVSSAGNVVMCGCKSRRITSTTSVGLSSASPNNKINLVSCDLASYPTTNYDTRMTITDCYENGSKIPNSYRGVLNFIEGTGAHTAGYTGVCGSLMTHNDGAKGRAYIRNTLGNNNEWVPLVSNPSPSSFLPETDNTISIGSGSSRWSQIYAANGNISTSDEKQKTEITDPNEALMKAWGKVNFKVFKFKDAVENKGENARKHVGVIAQEVQKAFESEKLNASDYGLFCYDAWEDQYKEITSVDEKGIEHIDRKLVQKAGSTYGIRYTEALALECAYQRWLGTKREARIKALEAKLK